MARLTRISHGLRLPSLYEEMDNLLRDMGWVFGESALRSHMAWFPIDIYETRDEYVVTAELAGVPRDNIDVNLDRTVLSIRVKKEAPELPEGASYHTRERHYGEFTRSIALPSDIDPERISASYTDGVLEVRVAKAEESKPRRIDITAK